MNVLKVYDNEGKTIDRYTVVTDEKHNGLYDCLGLSEHPEEPLGFSQWGDCVIGNHLGKEIKFEKLPFEVQEHIKCRLEQ